MTAPQDNTAVDEAVAAIRSFEFDSGASSREDEIAELTASVVVLEAQVSADAHEIAELRQLVDDTEGRLGQAILERDEARDRIIDLEQSVAILEARIRELEDLLDPPPADHPRYHYGIALVWQNAADYGDIGAVFDELDWLGVKSIRGRFQSGARGAQVMAECLARGIKWCVSFAPEDWFEVIPGRTTPSIDTIRARFEADMRECMALPGAAEVVEYVEVANEPAQSRNYTVVGDWAARVIVLSLVAARVRDELGVPAKITTAGHHMDDHNGADWLAIVGSYADVINLHSYPGGLEATNGLDARIAKARAAFPGLPVIVTEHGWVVKPPCTDKGPKMVTAAQQATYVGSAPGLLFDHPDVEHAYLFELRDGAGTGVQDCRGLIRGGTWRPAGEALRAALA